MKYPYAVKCNGEYYPSGADVPEGGALMPENNTKKTYSKTDINRMPVEDLRKLALEEGAAGAETMTGVELKKYLIETFGL